jgi:1,4-dihydroxy-2-naphthoate octaprenyltransferase
MGQRLDRFLAGSPKPLRLGFLGFVVGLLGVALGFSIDYGPRNPLAYLAFGIVGLGVAIGFIAVAWGWYTIFKPSGDRGDRRGT